MIVVLWLLSLLFLLLLLLLLFVHIDSLKEVVWFWCDFGRVEAGYGESMQDNLWYNMIVACWHYQSFGVLPHISLRLEPRGTKAKPIEPQESGVRKGIWYEPAI